MNGERREMLEVKGSRIKNKILNGRHFQSRNQWKFKRIIFES